MLSSDGKTGPAIPVPDARELRSYTFRYAIYPHRGDWKSAYSYRQALEFNCALDGMQLRGGEKLPHEKSFLSIKPENVILSALKVADDGDGIILRFYEAAGENTDAEITFFREPAEVKAVNLLEYEDEEVSKGLQIEGKRIKLNVKPFEIVTLRLRF